MKKLTLMAAAMIVAAGTAFAGAHALVSEQRVKAMKDIGGAMKGIGTNSGDATEHAQRINALLNGMMEMFPEGSAVYRAKPIIWQDFGGFEAAMNKSIAASEKLQMAAKSGDRDATMAALKNLGGTCKGCHDTFRGPKPK